MAVDNLAAEVARLRARGLGSRRIAAQLGISRWQVRKLLPKVERKDTTVTRGEPSGATLNGPAEAVVTLPTGATVNDLPAVLRSFGLDEKKWRVDRVTASEWDALADGGGGEREPRVVKLRQLKVHLRHVDYEVKPAAEVAVRHKPDPANVGREVTRLVAVLGDQQAPYHDERLHGLVLAWLADLKPDEVVFDGDLLDHPTISRHRDRLRWNASVQECVDAGFRLLSDYRDAAPDARMRMIRGNHDWRLEAELMDRAERVAFLRPAQKDASEEPHLYSLRRLLHLDALHVELCGREGEDWRMDEVVLAPGLVVRHEPPSKQKAARLNRSVIAGHTHHQGYTPVTCFDDEDRPVVRAIVEAGTLASVRDGLGYAERPDWQQGFATVAIDPDGTHHFDLATYRGGVLTWRGERWG